MDHEELKAFFVSIGEKPFRAKQVYQWMHEKQADGFDEMSNLSKNLREKLSEICEYTCLENVQYISLEAGRDTEISVPPFRRLCDRECADALPARQFGLYFHTGRLPYGLPFLRLHDRGKDKRSDGWRDA